MRIKGETGKTWREKILSSINNRFENVISKSQWNYVKTMLLARNCLYNDGYSPIDNAVSRSIRRVVMKLKGLVFLDSQYQDTFSKMKAFFCLLLSVCRIDVTEERRREDGDDSALMTMVVYSAASGNARESGWGNVMKLFQANEKGLSSKIDMYQDTRRS